LNFSFLVATSGMGEESFFSFKRWNPALLRGNGLEDNWTILRVLQWTTQYFSGKGIAQARANAEVLLAHALGTERIQLYLNYDRPLSPAELARYREMIRRRAAFEPTQYIVGTQEFWSLEFEVSPAVLIPRPETEVLVQRALEILGDDHALVLDLGTGSGAIPVALAHERSTIRVIATDRSFEALVVAKRNAARNDVSSRVHFVLADLFEGLSVRRPFDLIVSNPPYVSEPEFSGLAPEISRYEPTSALRGGGELGLDLIRKICEQFQDYLKPGGSLLVEIGRGQAEILERDLESGFSGQFSFIPDYSGIKRVLHLRNPKES
jgi:release factor glutamine methyltransferase